MPDSGPDAGFAVPIATSLVARLCHDLAGPLAAVLAGLEMAAEDGPRAGGADDPLAVAADSTRQLSGRLALLRAAWGVEPGPLGRIAIATLADGLANRGRLALDLDGLGDEPVPGAVGQVLLNMLLLAGVALPKGGRITLARDGDLFAARIAGPVAAWPAGMTAILLAPEETEPTPRTALPIMLGLLARKAGMRVSLPLASGIVGAAAAPLLLSPA